MMGVVMILYPISQCLLSITVNIIVISMSSKFKIEYYHKVPQSTSPYLQLLQAKKKIFGYKYEIVRNDKSVTHTHNKSYMQNNSQPPYKHSKAQSHQKEKSKSQKQNSRKKRSQTEQAEDRLHESLFLNQDNEQFATQDKEDKRQATKSLFPIESSHEQSINPHDFLKNYKQILERDDKALKSMTQQVQRKSMTKDNEHLQSVGNSLDKLQITEIDELLNLIDGCIEQSNDYIGYLTEKIDGLRSDITTVREEQVKVLKMKDAIINEKEHEVDRLKKELYCLQYAKPETDSSFEVKKLLQIIDKITEENKDLKRRLIQLSPGKESIEKDKKDVYNSIHNKIDILNISIDKKNHEGGLSGGEDTGGKDGRKAKHSKPRFYK